MAQIVIEFGASALNPVFDAVMALTGGPTSVGIWGHGIYPATKDTIGDLPRRLVDGEISGVALYNEMPEVCYGLVLAPHFEGQECSMWMGTIELTTPDWRPHWDRLLQFRDLTFVCVGDEEGVELNDLNLTVESFPWDEWPLIVGALRGSNSDWVIRERISEDSRSA